MESLPIYSEHAVSQRVKLPLNKRDDYFCLLSGGKWSVLDDGILFEIRDICKNHCLELIYFPDIFSAYSDEVLEYNFPGMELGGKIHHNMFVYKILGILNENLSDNGSMIIRYNSAKQEFNYYKFEADTEYEFILNIRSYAEWVTGLIIVDEYDICELPKKKRDNGIRFCIKNDLYEEGCNSNFYDLPMADRHFTSEQNRLIDIAIDAVAKLQLQGISLDVIKELITQKIELSRLVITEKGKIFLPDYNNKEVIMGPLPKTIFLFFLKHDREFMFSDLMDYKQELLAIYEKISNRGDRESMIESIEKLTDPTRNSICENVLQ